jgi:hypothetical protein
MCIPANALVDHCLVDPWPLLLWLLLNPFKLLFPLWLRVLLVNPLPVLLVAAGVGTEPLTVPLVAGRLGVLLVNPLPILLVIVVSGPSCGCCQ